MPRLHRPPRAAGAVSPSTAMSFQSWATVRTIPLVAISSSLWPPGSLTWTIPPSPSASVTAWSRAKPSRSTPPSSTPASMIIRSRAAPALSIRSRSAIARFLPRTRLGHRAPGMSDIALLSVRTGTDERMRRRLPRDSLRGVHHRRAAELVDRLVTGPGRRVAGDLLCGRICRAAPLQVGVKSTVDEGTRLFRRSSLGTGTASGSGLSRMYPGAVCPAPWRQIDYHAWQLTPQHSQW